MGNYKRLHTIGLDTVLLSIAFEQPIVIDGLKIKTGGPRLRTYLKGTACVGCQIKASYFAVEAAGPEFQYDHLNLYALNTKGHEVMMTSDHIHPKSKGGRGHLENRQPMCKICNTDKADVIITNEEDIQVAHVTKPVKIKQLLREDTWLKTGPAETDDGIVVTPWHPKATKFSLMGALFRCHIPQGKLWSPEFEEERTRIMRVIIKTRHLRKFVTETMKVSRMSHLQLGEFSSMVNWPCISLILDEMEK